VAVKISKDNLAALVDSLRRSGMRVVAPVSRTAFTEFAEIVALDEADFSQVNTRSSIKQFLFPATEPILSYSLEQSNVKLECEEPPEPRKTVIIGSRPCDAASLPILDKLFSWDCEDRFYLNRRSATVVISIACTDCDDCCFCTAIGLGPDSKQGSDLLLVPGESGCYNAEPCTERGAELVKQHEKLFTQSAAPASVCKAVLEKLPKPLNLDRIANWLRGHFYDDFWQAASLKCVGCGCCTFLCPTCHCFDITDEHGRYRDGRRAGLRRKNWDSCQFAQFTLHASGHNPRPDRASRWRQRMMHKFLYYPERFGSRLCTGCGRCVRSCPVQMDIRDQLKAIESMQADDEQHL